MAKKVKCIECMEFMNWALPHKINADNLEDLDIVFLVDG